MRRTGKHTARYAIDRLRQAVGLVLCVVAGASPVRAQVMRYGVVMDAARNALAAEWTEDPAQVERAYCVTQWWSTASHSTHMLAPNDSTVARSSDADTVYRVIAIKPMVTSEATPNSATFACPRGVPEVHTHPPATCYGDRTDRCYAGGADAYSCQPSREDVQKLVQRGDAFAIVQCDRHAFVFYYAPKVASGGSEPVAMP